MNKLTEKLKATIDDKIVTSPSKIIDCVYDTRCESIDPSDIGEYYKFYVLKAGFKAGYMLTKHELENEECEAHVKQKLQKLIIEEVFGEYRLMISHIRHSLYERDIPRAFEELSNLESHMFDV